jgi:hypothetical protein
MTITPRRRAVARAPHDGLARVEQGVRSHCFRIADVSFGGLGLIGDARAFSVGTRVRVFVTSAFGARLDTCPRLDAWAEVRRAEDDRLGLAWSLTDPESAELIIYLVDDARLQDVADRGRALAVAGR